jgi:hypothetical protein
METISLSQARRIALAAQGFGGRRTEPVGPVQLHRLVQKIHLHQIDSVNVLSRAHYLPAFSRLGAYDRSDLDRLAWGPKRQRRLFEYWGHEASLLPFDLHPCCAGAWHRPTGAKPDGERCEAARPKGAPKRWPCWNVFARRARCPCLISRVIRASPAGGHGAIRNGLSSGCSGQAISPPRRGARP